MIRFAGKAALLIAMGLLCASAALAGVPNAGQSDINFGCPSGSCAQNGILTLGGNSSGVVDAKCEKQVLIKDAAGNFVNNSVVIINFSTCYAGGDVHISNAQPFPGVTFSCGSRTVQAVTNASGIAVFRIQGFSNSTLPGDPGAGEGCATITADSVPLGSYSVATPDLNGRLGGANLGVGGGDFTVFNQNRQFGPYRVRCNYAKNAGPQAIDGGDFTVFNQYRISGSATNGPDCP